MDNIVIIYRKWQTMSLHYKVIVKMKWKIADMVNPTYHPYFMDLICMLGVQEDFQRCTSNAFLLFDWYSHSGAWTRNTGVMTFTTPEGTSKLILKDFVHQDYILDCNE